MNSVIAIGKSLTTWLGAHGEQPEQRVFAEGQCLGLAFDPILQPPGPSASRADFEVQAAPVEQLVRLFEGFRALALRLGQLR